MFTIVPLVPRYDNILPFEKHFNPLSSHRWMANNWHLSIIISATYLVTICIYTRRSKVSATPQSKGYSLPLFLWNLSISLFSFVGALRTLPELYHSMHFFGFHHTVCDAAYMVKDPVSGFWTLASVISKAVVLGDTLFVMLRGRPVVLLHGFHHASVLVAGWLTYSHKMAVVRWFVFLDFNVNTLLYGYFAARSLRISMPRPVTFAVTALQILQMVPGTYFSLYAYLCWWYEDTCDVTGPSAHTALILYVCYLILFLEFFYSTYIERGREEMKKLQ